MTISRVNKVIWSLFVLALITLGTTLKAQTIVVLDQETESPIVQVTIQASGTNDGAITDEFGKADISRFAEDAILTLRHPSYKPVQIKMSRLANQNFTIYMVEQITATGEIVVSANKWEQNKREIPQEIAVFEAEDIARAEPPTTADLLGSNSQVFIQKSQLGGGSPVIRGFAANSVLIVVDGVRMNNAIYRSGNLQNVITIDPNNLREAEVVFGPGSVVYGSDALGGVMDFHSITPDFSDTGLSFSGSGMLRYASAADAVTGNVNFSVGTKNFSSFTGITYSSFGDLRTGSNRTDEFPDFGKRFEYVDRQGDTDVIVANDDVNVQIPSGYDQFNVLQKFRWKTSSFSDISYAFHYSTSSDIPRYERLIQRDDQGELRSAEWYYGPQLWQMHSLQMRYFYPTQLFDQVKLVTAYQQVEESRNDRRFGRDALRTREEFVDVLSLNIDFERSFGLNNDLYYGIELVGNQIDSEAKSTNIASGQVSPESTRYPDGGSTYNSAAAYMSLKNELNQRLILSTGLRYSFVKINSKFEDKSFYNFPYDEIDLENGALNGSIGLVYLPNKNWKLNTMLSSGFRSPNIDDIGKVFDSEPGVAIVPNPDLKPETSYNFEYGISGKLGNGFSLSFVNYFSRLDNAMVRRPFTFNGQDRIIYDGVLSDVFAEVNVGEAFIWGISAQFDWQLQNRLNWYANFTYTEGEDTVENLPLRHVPPAFGETGFKYESGKLRSSFVLKYSGSIAFEDLAPSEQNKPHLYTADGSLAWYTINLYNSYRFNDFLSVNLNLENLLDTHYRPYSSGISAPGFNATLSLRAKF